MQSVLPSVLSLIGEAVGRRRHGAPDTWRRAVRASLSRRDLAALVPVYGRDSIVLPDSLTPLPVAGVVSIRETVDQIAAVDPETLLAEGATEYGDAPPPAWQYVEAQPVRWLEAYATAIGNAAYALDDVWRMTRRLVDRETERVGAASVLGASREVLGTLHARGRLVDGDLRLDRDGSAPARWVLPPEGLTLVPMLAGSGALVSCHREDFLTHLAYPIPGQFRLLGTEPEQQPALGQLLGLPRARVLRMLDEPASAGAIAEALQGVPSVATHHVAALESAGLVERERHGQRVMVRRTSRGSALLALYDDA